MNEFDPGVIAALVAAIGSLLVAVLGYFATRRNQEKLSQYQQKNQRELAALKAKLDEQQAEKDARRDYEYEARKRLYQEFEPPLFQLVEASDNALHRIYSLARTARDGDISPSGEGWLSRPGYYMRSTIYKLLSPAAIVKLIQRRLTFVDLSVDPKVRAQYILARALYDSFIDDFDLANIRPAIDYDPNFDADDDEEEWFKRRKSNPQKYWRQGLTWGQLDLATDGLLIREKSSSSDTLRLMSYGEFEEAIKDEDTQLSPVFAGMLDGFYGFHPSTRPVLWRMLVAQAHLYRAIIRASQFELTDPDRRRDLLQPIASEEDRSSFYWYEKSQQKADLVDLDEPFEAAWLYLEEHLKPLLVWEEAA